MGAERDFGRGRWDTARVETFSDAVLAIAITLLVLDIKVPAHLHHLSHALGDEWPSYLAYATSFLTIGTVWVTHHAIFSPLRYVDATLMRLNLLLLMTTAFLPFPTGILAEALRASSTDAELAVVLYGTTALAIELLLRTCMRHVAKHREMHAPHAHDALAWRSSWTTATIVLYALGIVLGVLNLPEVATATYLLLALRGMFLLGAARRHTAIRPIPRRG